MENTKDGSCTRFFQAIQSGVLGGAAVAAEAARCGANLAEYYILCIELPRNGVGIDQWRLPVEQVMKARMETYCFETGADRAYVILCRSVLGFRALMGELEQAFALYTGRALNLGVSMLGSGPEGLAVAFEQAETALEKAFFQPQAAVHLFYPETCTGKTENRDIDALIAFFEAAVARGDGAACMDRLGELFHLQRSELRPGEVRRDGLLLVDLCVTQLERLDIKLDEVNSLAQCQEELPGCGAFSDYCALVRGLLRESSAAIEKKLAKGGSVVLDARNYIEQNYHRPITLGEIAKAVNANAGYLSRSFKSKMGASLVETINQRKVIHAKKLLATGKMKIREVASAVGIEDMAYFSHLFRKMTGMSPRDYQKWCLHGKAGGED